MGIYFQQEKNIYLLICSCILMPTYLTHSWNFILWFTSTVLHWERCSSLCQCMAFCYGFVLSLSSLIMTTQDASLPQRWIRYTWRNNSGTDLISKHTHCSVTELLIPAQRIMHSLRYDYPKLKLNCLTYLKNKSILYCNSMSIKVC